MGWTPEKISSKNLQLMPAKKFVQIHSRNHKNLFKNLIHHDQVYWKCLLRVILPPFISIFNWLHTSFNQKSLTSPYIISILCSHWSYIMYGEVRDIFKYNEIIIKSSIHAYVTLCNLICMKKNEYQYISPEIFEEKNHITNEDFYCWIIMLLMSDEEKVPSNHLSLLHNEED